MHMDINELNNTIADTNSATKVAESAEKIRHNKQFFYETRCEAEKRNTTLVAGAKANIEQRELLEQQLEFMQQQNILLCENYEKLKEMYDNQVQTNLESKEDLAQSRKHNKWMMVISVVSMLAAIGGTIITAIAS